MQDPIKYSETLIKTMNACKPLSKANIRALVEHVEMYLIEAENDVTAQYSRLASHILKWIALPEKRDGSWMDTVRSAKNELRDMEYKSRNLANYIHGHGAIRGRKMEPEHVYDAALRWASTEYADHTGVTLSKARQLFVAALPSAPPLAFWLNYEMKSHDLPAWHARHPNNSKD